MRISKIEFENFRNFRDYGKIRCSTDGKVTIIYGKNGDGKTTLHQLFQWIFYGQVHFNKTTTDRLYNLQFESEQPYGSTFDVMGRIDFEHEGVQYSLTRTYKYKKGIDDSEKIGEDFSLNQRDEDFNWKRVDRPKEVIEKMLPSGLSEYFFFDGESMINSIVEDDGGVPGCMKTYLKSIDSTERQIICNIIKKSILDKGLIVPKMLVLKYFLQIESSSASKNDCKKIFAVYFYTVLFMLFGDKKSDAEKIKKVAKSNDFYKDLISEIKTFVSASKMATTHLTAISRWNSNFENEDLQYKCKSLATIYNYFKLENNVVSVTSVDNLNSFLSNEEKYSVEHFVINKSGTIKYLDDKDEYHLPENTRQYGTYIFNFIFIPRKLNGTVLGNYSLQRKLRILKEDNNLKDIDCEYSKMIISTLDGKFNGAIDVKTLNEQETEELDKYWLVTFKREYPQFTEAVIDEVVKRLRENIK